MSFHFRGYFGIPLALSLAGTPLRLLLFLVGGENLPRAATTSFIAKVKKEQFLVSGSLIIKLNLFVVCVVLCYLMCAVFYGEAWNQS